MGGRKKRKKDGKREGGAKGREKRKGWREETRKEESKEARKDGFPPHAFRLQAKAEHWVFSHPWSVTCTVGSLALKLSGSDWNCTAGFPKSSACP